MTIKKQILTTLCEAVQGLAGLMRGSQTPQDAQACASAMRDLALAYTLVKRGVMEADYLLPKEVGRDE